MAEDADVESSAGDDERADPGENPTKTAVHDGAKPGVRLALAVGVVAVLALTGLVGWLGHRALQSHHTEEQRELFLTVARQGALDLTTISHTEVDTDVQRILDSSTGTFRDDFSRRRQPFIDLIKRDRSTSQGTITEAGLQSMTENSARALVAVSVRLSTAGAAEQKLDGFRLRIDVQRVGGGAKVSDVEYVQ